MRESKNTLTEPASNQFQDFLVELDEKARKAAGINGESFAEWELEQLPEQIYSEQVEKHRQNMVFNSFDGLWRCFNAEQNTTWIFNDKKAAIKEQIGLCDDFFLSCPGLVGDIIRELTHYSLDPHPSFLFAVAAATIGAYRGSFSRVFARPKPICSNLYFLCLAGTGSGKNYPQTAIMSALCRAFEQEGFENDLRSDIGLFQKFSTNGCTGIILHDEAHHSFQAWKSESAGNHASLIKKRLLALYTAWEMPLLSAGNTVSKELRISPLIHPSVSYVGFGVPEGFDTTFDQTDFTDGFLSRLIILKENKLLSTRTDIPHVNKYQFEENPVWKDLIKNARAYKQMRCNLQTQTSDQFTPLGFQRIEMTSEAQELYLSWYVELKEERNQLKKQDSDQPDIKTRIFEQTGKIAMAICDGDNVTKSEIQWAIGFAKNYLDRTSELIESRLKPEQVKRNQKIIAIMSKQPNKIWKKTEIGQRCRSTLFQRGSDDVSHALRQLEEDGMVHVVPLNHEKQSCPGSGRKAAIGYLLDSNEILNQENKDHQTPF